MFIRLMPLSVAEVMFSCLHVPLWFRYKAVVCTQQNVHFMLCTEEHKTYSTNRHAKSNLFRTYTLYYKLWYNFLGRSSSANKVFIFHKKIIRIITNIRPRDSCKEVFKSMEIMTLYSQYIYSLVLYTINNKHLFDANNEIHKYKARYNSNLHRPVANLSKFNKGTYISDIKFLIAFLSIVKLWLMTINILNPHWRGSYIIILSPQWMNIMNIRKIEEYKP